MLNMIGGITPFTSPTGAAAVPRVPRREARRHAQDLPLNSRCGSGVWLIDDCPPVARWLAQRAAVCIGFAVASAGTQHTGRIALQRLLFTLLPPWALQMRQKCPERRHILSKVYLCGRGCKLGRPLRAPAAAAAALGKLFATTVCAPPHFPTAVQHQAPLPLRHTTPPCVLPSPCFLAHGRWEVASLVKSLLTVL